MTNHYCRLCRGDGLVFIRYTDSPGYDVAVCRCDQGGWWKTDWQIKAWYAKQDPKPEQIGRLAEFFTEAELRVLTTVVDDAPGVNRKVIVGGF